MSYFEEGQSPGKQSSLLAFCEKMRFLNTRHDFW